MRLLATCQYDGSLYSGWQIQPEDFSVQEAIEKAVSQILNKTTKIYGSGRTDAGVHAEGQTFHFDIDEERDVEKLRYSINAVLPEDIHIIKLEKVANDFHARFSAKSKTYRYTLNCGEYDVFKAPFEAHQNRPVDVQSIKDCLDIFLGKHCFKNFTTKEEDEDNFIREVTDFTVEQVENRVIFTIRGDGFMRYMVRMIVGSLIAVGIGKLTRDDLIKILNKEDRGTVFYKADAKGLTLVKVEY